MAIIMRVNQQINIIYKLYRRLANHSNFKIVQIFAFGQDFSLISLTEQTLKILKGYDVLNYDKVSYYCESLMIILKYRNDKQLLYVPSY